MCTSTSPQCSDTTSGTQHKCLIRLQHQSFAWFVVSIRESFNGIGTAVFRMFTTTGYFFAASSYTKVHTKSMFTARKQSCGKVMFSQVCVSVHRGWGWVLPGVGIPGGGYSSPFQIHGLLLDTVNKQVVRILLECFLVFFVTGETSLIVTRNFA